MSSPTKTERRQRVKKGIRKKIFGSQERPRLSVYRSNTSIYAQIVDDTTGTTLASASSRMKDFVDPNGSKVEDSATVGKTLAAKALAKGITKVVFDRNGFKYHGRIKALADGAREGGLQF